MNNVPQRSGIVEKIAWSDGWTRPRATTPPRFRGWQKIEKEPMWVPQRAALIQYEVQNFSGSFDGTVRVRASSITHSYDKKILKHTNALKYDENSETNARTQTQVRARILPDVG